MSVLNDDERPIRELRSECDSEWCVGRNGCTRIVAYDESGEMFFVPWFAIYFGDEVKVRVPARTLSVHYQ